MDLSKVSTCELVEELKKREGVYAYEIAPYEEKYKICKCNDESIDYERIDTFGEDGGAIILEIID